MSEKSSRLAAIRRLIGGGNIQNQEDLLRMVQEQGFALTQATLSRDLKELRVAKVHDPKYGYCYRLQESAQSAAGALATGNFSEGIKSVAFSSSFAVVKTHPGFAGAVASVIDNHVLSSVLGTIAGDDTVLVILSDGCQRAEALESLADIIPGIENKLI